MLENYITQFYHAARNEQLRLGHDFAMINALEDDVQANQDNQQLVYRWMHSYGLFQGVTNGQRWLVVQSFLQFAQQWRQENGQRQDAVKALHDALYIAVPRVWISATSKLLWCMYPNDVVIYDRFVEAAVSVLQSLTPELRALPPLGNRPRVQDDNTGPLIDFYFRYDALVRALYASHEHVFVQLEGNDNAYPYRLRVLDKLLWMIGDQNSALERAPQANGGPDN